MTCGKREIELLNSQLPAGQLRWVKRRTGRIALLEFGRYWSNGICCFVCIHGRNKWWVGHLEIGRNVYSARECSPE